MIGSLHPNYWNSKRIFPDRFKLHKKPLLMELKEIAKHLAAQTRLLHAIIVGQAMTQAKDFLRFGK